MRIFIAFTISLLVYVLLIWLFITQFSKIKPIKPHKNEHIIKIDIRDIPLPVKPKAVPKTKKPTVTKRPIAKKPIKKTIPKKKPVKKKIVVKKRPIKKVIKKKPIKKKTIIKQAEIINEPIEEILYIPEPIKKTIITPPKQDDLASFFSTPSVNSSQRQSYPSSKVKKLYGSSFHSFTATQKAFIKENLDTIQEITQKTLTRRGYPEGAGNTGQEGTNVVSFNLHPNGDISNLRLKTRIGFRALDDNTLSLIRVAYKDYPYPKTTTKIVFYVTYSIYGY